MDQINDNSVLQLQLHKCFPFILKTYSQKTIKKGITFYRETAVHVLYT